MKSLVDPALLIDMLLKGGANLDSVLAFDRLSVLPKESSDIQACFDALERIQDWRKTLPIEANDSLEPEMLVYLERFRTITENVVSEVTDSDLPDPHFPLSENDFSATSDNE